MLISYTYDELGRAKSRAINGVAERITYDSLDRLTGLTNVLGAFTNFYVNNTLRVASNNYANGQTTAFSYLGNTNDQRLQGIWHRKSDGSTISKFDYVYDADGRITNWTHQIASETPKAWVAEYDTAHQLLAVTVRSNGTAGAILNRYVYAYDKAGNRTSEQVDLGVSTATHNDLNQLVSVPSSAGSVRFRGSLNEIGTVTVAGALAAFETRNSNFVAYAEAATGTNVVPVVATDYSNNKATNRYQVIVTNNGVSKTLAYDVNGNLTSVATSTGTNLYEWDAANRLTAIDARQAGQTTNRTEFTYDGFNRRVRTIEKTNSVIQSETRLIWVARRVLESRDANGIILRRYFSRGETIATNSYSYTRDHLGSIREMLDLSQGVQARYAYDPFGRKTLKTGTIESDLAFTGHVSRRNTDLALTWFRIYDPDTARWLSRDPIAELGGNNLYAYVSNDPLNNVDPDGRLAPIIGAALVVAGLIIVGYGVWKVLNGICNNQKLAEIGAANAAAKYENAADPDKPCPSQANAAAAVAIGNMSPDIFNMATGPGTLGGGPASPPESAGEGAWEIIWEWLGPEP